jgi:hypothetical protein
VTVPALRTEHLGNISEDLVTSNFPQTFLPTVTVKEGGTLIEVQHLIKSLSAWRGVLSESLQSGGCSDRFGGNSGKSTMANAWSVLSLILKKRSLYRFLSHLSMATGSELSMSIDRDPIS